MASFPHAHPTALRTSGTADAPTLTWWSWRRDYLSLAIYAFVWDSLVTLLVYKLQAAGNFVVFCFGLHILMSIAITIMALRVLPRRTTMEITPTTINVRSGLIPGLGRWRSIDISDVMFLQSRPRESHNPDVLVFGLMAYRQGVSGIEVVPAIVGAELTQAVGASVARALGVEHTIEGYTAS